MNCLYSILLACAVLFSACSETLPDAKMAEGEVEIFSGL